jgi:sialic acid synthase SpsE/mannose-6-phosphate isomerase-like protein (cupin superfamily)
VKPNFDFQNLFVLDLANNHQGQLQHGLRIIREVAEVTRARGVRAALKFQFRDLDTFVHPAHREVSDNKHIPRFLSTRLSPSEFATLTQEVRRQGLVTMSTPFDERSVDLIGELGIEVVKVASCSATDWPLIEKIAECNRPVIFSTGGVTLKEIDDLVSFFDHRRVHFAIMHCVSIYPTPDSRMQLNQIEVLRRRYPNTTIGFSTHERPEETMPVVVAVAKGARMLERHVGIEMDSIKLNAYSSTPAQLDAWIATAQRALALEGDRARPPAPQEEIESLLSLRRGVYAKRPIKVGAALASGDVYFAMPCGEGQLSSGEFKAGIVARDGLAPHQPLCVSSLEIPHNPDQQVLFTAIHSIKAMLNEARVVLNTEFEAEFSHHYGLAKFKEWGATIISCVNRSYCKKLVIQTPGQRHPSHYHQRKEETFQILHGLLEVEIDGRRRTLHPGDTLLVQQGVWHQFWTDTGVIFEEISTTHYNDDSFYEDKEINRLDRSQRKTVVNHWGRYQI